MSMRMHTDLLMKTGMMNAEKNISLVSFGFLANVAGLPLPQENGPDESSGDGACCDTRAKR